MADILVTPENLESEASNLMGHKSNLDSIFSEIKSLISGLISHWHGEAQQAFQDSFNQKEPVFTKFSQDMESFANFMKKYAADMRQAEQDGKSLASRLGA